jgi:hypothetical protein
MPTTAACTSEGGQKLKKCWPTGTTAVPKDKKDDKAIFLQPMLVVVNLDPKSLPCAPSNARLKLLGQKNAGALLSCKKRRRKGE